jgi:hypothetical protein
MTTRPFIEVEGKALKVEGRLIRIARLDGEKFTFGYDPERMIAALRDGGTRVDLFTFIQRIPETAPKYGYAMEYDNFAVLPVSTFDHWFKEQIKSYPRNRARQAEKKGVVLREVPFDDALLQGICDVYNETPFRQGRKFPHYGMDLARAHQYAGTFLDRGIFLGAFFEEKMIGFVKLVVDETRTHACAIHILSMIKHRDKAPTNALVAQAVRSCADRNIKYLVYENFVYGRKGVDSLANFKEVNGFQRMDLPRYYVPLTPLGRMALRAGLHHPLIDRFPEPLLARLRELRTAWYSRTLQHSSVEAS